MKRHAQRGITMVVVLILLTVMLLGGLAMARMTEVGTLAAGNAAYRGTALQAAEIGINAAFEKIRTQLPNMYANTGDWYYASIQGSSNTWGMPDILLGEYVIGERIEVGGYEVGYIVDRQCNVAVPDDPKSACLLRIQQNPDAPSGVAHSDENLDLPTAYQFRVTVRVRGPKSTDVWVQSLISGQAGSAVTPPAPGAPGTPGTPTTPATN
jgi:hypothetical protein